MGVKSAVCVCWYWEIWGCAPVGCRAPVVDWLGNWAAMCVLTFGGALGVLERLLMTRRLQESEMWRRLLVLGRILIA